MALNILGGCDEFRRLTIWFHFERDEQHTKTAKIKDMCFGVSDQPSESKVFQSLFGLSVPIPENRTVEKQLVSGMAMSKALVRDSLHSMLFGSPTIFLRLLTVVYTQA